MVVQVGVQRGLCRLSAISFFGCQAHFFTFELITDSESAQKVVQGSCSQSSDRLWTNFDDVSLEVQGSLLTAHPIQNP